MSSVREFHASNSGRPLDDDPFALALMEADKARGRTAPNPPVGASIVRGADVISVGHTQPAGEDHAEIVALKRAGSRARGAHMYVTLEPCCAHGLTPPCTDAIIDAGIARVSVGMIDPNPAVSGKGLAILAKAGIPSNVDDGARFRRPIAGFAKRLSVGQPYVASKWAMTLDGKSATGGGQSKWITSKESRELAHDLRDQVDAIIIGVGTVLADDPQLTPRPPRPHRPTRPNPLRVVLDPRARTPVDGRLVQTDDRDRTVIAFGPNAPRERLDRLVFAGVEFVAVPSDEPSTVARWVLGWLADQKVNEVLVEGGGETHWNLLAAGLVDEIWAFVGAKVVGGRMAVPAVGGEGFSSLDQLDVSSITVRQIGSDALLTAEIGSEWRRTHWCSAE